MYLPKDLLQYVLNLYLDYEDLDILDLCFDFKFDRNIHIQIDEEKNIKITYIDNDLRKIQTWYSNGCKMGEENYRNGKKDGKEYKFYFDGNIKSIEQYKDELLDGKQYYYMENNKRLKYEKYYENGKLKYLNQHL